MIIKEKMYKPNLKKRIIATLVDYGLFLLALFLYLMIFGEENESGKYSVSGLKTLPINIAWFLYFVVYEATNGATMAHQAFKLKVVSLDGKSLKLSQAFKRHLLDPIDILLCGIPAIIAIKNSDKCQRLGDMWAKTVVVDVGDADQIVDTKVV